jgi:general secretion pathway protein E/type IV pilus assembly protein PilB
MALGTILQEKGLLTKADLDRASAESQSTGERIDRVLVRLGLVRREDVLQAIGDQFHMPVVDLSSISVEPQILAALPSRLVYKQKCVPIARNSGILTVATSDPYDISVLDELKLLTGSSIELALADEDELHKFIRANYGVGGDTLDAMSAGQTTTTAKAEPGSEDELEQAQEASVVKLVNDILSEAISERATDVHIEPYERELVVRYRIDGVLQRANVPATIHRFGSAVISRLKIMSNLNIAEKRKPQDGRISFKNRSTGRPMEEFDLRVSVIPMMFGEGVVLRVLSKAAVLMPLDELGMPQHVLGRWATLLHRPHGIMLVTGPTGSGKSTTLYASLNKIVTDEIKVITVEDPVEYHVPGVNQIQVNHKVGLDFAAGLRSILRHDPDVVMIGEIRDKETAETAIQASLTGHLVFSTLHTNDAPGAMTRLLDMRVEPFLVSSSVEAVMAQRLVRRICRECGEAYVPEAAEMPIGLKLAPGQTLSRGKGCRACRNTGFRGRVGVYELLTLTERVREMIMERTSAPALAAQAMRENSLCTLAEDGYAKARAGLTTIEEVVGATTA